MSAAAAEGLTNKIAEVRSTIKFQLKKILYPSVPIGPPPCPEER
jgi:hypothetical protein